MERIDTVAGLRGHVAGLRADGRTVGLVPTMGALHEGHLALVRRLADEVDSVVVSVFVNPTQFDRPEDLRGYPRDLHHDLELLADLQAATPGAVFSPSVHEMYPREPRATVIVRGDIVEGLCGASRPGHFDGVATVVTKLLNIVTPDVAAFGRKDRQQLEVVRRMVQDLDLPVRILDVPTVREPDGVALSSRNRRLDPEQRRTARALPAALAAAVEEARTARARAQELDVEAVRERAMQILSAADGLELDYLEIVDPVTMRPGPRRPGPTARLVVAVAAQVGPVRLIDNVELGDRDDEDALLVGVERGSDPAHSDRIAAHPDGRPGVRS